jgi:hypothetical protein
VSDDAADTIRQIEWLLHSYRSNPVETPPSPARIADFGVELRKPTPFDAEGNRAVVGAWIEWRASKPEGHCETCDGARLIQAAVESAWGPVAEQCQACANQTPHSYLLKFDREWLVDQLINVYGGDLDRVPTLEQLKALL